MLKRTCLSDEEILKALLTIRTSEQLDYFRSYGVDNDFELYEYFFNLRSVCECSYELQCAVYDTVPEVYDRYVDAHFIKKLEHLRVDKYFNLLPIAVLMFFFGEKK